MTVPPDPPWGTPQRPEDPWGNTPPPPPPPPSPPAGYGHSPPPPPPPGYYAQVPPELQDAAGKKLAAGLCAILIGSIGIHKFVLGYTTSGLIMLLVTILTCGFGGIVMHVISIIEGILYLTKSDAEFYQTYIVNRKEWF